MKNFIQRLLFLTIALTLPYFVFSQDTIPKPSPETIFKIDGEWRPRFEFRDGYRRLPADTFHPAVFTSMRSRLNLFFQKGIFSTYLSIQDVRIWGEHGIRDTSSGIKAFQAWAEIKLYRNISVRFGRQTLIYDNERLFAQNNWNQYGGAHDALNFRYAGKKTESELAFAFNQYRENVFGTDYAPLQAKRNYKMLIVHWFIHKFNDTWQFNTINASDGFQSVKDPERLYLRFTQGGRIDFNRPKLYLTFSGYYQWGKNPNAQSISAYYFQTEARYSPSKKFTLLLGGEYMSGNDATDSTNKKYNSFIPLYGVAHRFMGSMDYFIRFPEDTKGAGLINPYFKVGYDISKKVKIRSDYHLFFLQNNYLYKKNPIDKYLGFENDILLSYSPVKEIRTEIGYSWMIAGKSMEIIKGGDRKEFPQWLYIMVTVKPEIFSFQK